MKSAVENDSLFALRPDTMSDQNPPVRIPESEDEAVVLVEEDMDEEESVDEQKENLIRAQKRLIDGSDSE